MPEVLTEVFELYLIFFEGGFGQVETEAINCQFLSISSQLINEINYRFMTVETGRVIKRLNNSLVNLQLRREMFLNFIFKINVRRVNSP